MGGGDLNLKKSWHPQTLRNIERVWKAEQKHEDERRKIEQLQNELKEEKAREDMRMFAEEQGAVRKKDDRLNWMYQGQPEVNRDDYLLGKPIDKAIQEVTVGKSEDPGLADNVPGASFSQSNVNSAVDMAAKIREDPLFAIKQREQQSKKELLNNPVKMKQLQQMLKVTLDKKDKKKKKKDKKKKHKKHKRSSSSDSDERVTGEAKVTCQKEVKVTCQKKVKVTCKKKVKVTRQEEVTITSKEISTKKEVSVKEKLDPEELERRRREMMQDAKTRDDERWQRVQKYKEDAAKEKEEDDKFRGKERAFHGLLTHTAATVEDRIKRKVHSLQRTEASKEKFFHR
ncbi:CWC25 [Branchiostoma lanceolatum]|uniref:CWC25 protein n=1 Tax=Branchiostoma lanceolatum TaxID=7740 RepID=A0A8J9Z919_BRALA|nr:CWC25 [Branchiostoma lanceolatum]